MNVSFNNPSDEITSPTTLLLVPLSKSVLVIPAILYATAGALRLLPGFNSILIGSLLETLSLAIWLSTTGTKLSGFTVILTLNEADSQPISSKRTTV